MSDLIQSSFTIRFENVSDHNTEELFMALHELFNACGGHCSSIDRINDNEFKMSINGTKESLKRFLTRTKEVFPTSGQ